ncbi:RNA-binding S4 domain-containing protein [Shimia marina]|uniref:Heat shock protein 15 n=1 Tax=Shimia marina TaxID=321267 RepID=A0A0P1ERZ8_9RHOB|nr:RNA-binding S4 domain-containing protein [Shimia marina]CUH53289.1 Heat shock protein 15 [Shimia marina]SFD80636.1 heat shock protein Hsp15 [Shimia marina]
MATQLHQASALKLRADKWLWQARFFKTRSLSAKVITGGHLRVNGTKVAKASYGVTSGDVLTFPQAKKIRVVKVLALGERRGPAPEAQKLYEDLTPEEKPVPKAPGADGKGRPTKRDRRNLDLMKASRVED